MWLLVNGRTGWPCNGRMDEWRIDQVSQSLNMTLALWFVGTDSHVWREIPRGKGRGSPRVPGPSGHSTPPLPPCLEGDYITIAGSKAKGPVNLQRMMYWGVI
mmetsp:Transcript_25502/g.41962  ORF Transcript_25502/g.41962 Transcript_25502/m.41962 type:complete len:102 (-) Transcript_25502:249-554(-)